jgi:hypothetical protein
LFTEHHTIEIPSPGAGKLISCGRRNLAHSFQQALAEPLGSSPVALCLKIHINHFAALIYGSPQIVLLAIDLNGPAQ